jgi:hypothetical protein
MNGLKITKYGEANLPLVFILTRNDMKSQFDAMYEAVMNEAVDELEDVASEKMETDEIPAGEKAPTSKFNVPEYQYVISDFDKVQGEGGLFDQLEKALKKLGIKMYDIPSLENEDTYGYILSRTELSKNQLEQIDKELMGKEEVRDVEPDETEENDEAEGVAVAEEPEPVEEKPAIVQKQ